MHEVEEKLWRYLALGLMDCVWLWEASKGLPTPEKKYRPAGVRGESPGQTEDNVTE